MTNFPSEALPAGAQTYRLVVRASRSAKKQFVWEILDDSNESLCVQAAKQAFRSLEDAYNAGKGALDSWRDKAMLSAVRPLPVSSKEATSATMNSDATSLTIAAR